MNRLPAWVGMLGVLGGFSACRKAGEPPAAEVSREVPAVVERLPVAVVMVDRAGNEMLGSGLVIARHARPEDARNPVRTAVAALVPPWKATSSPTFYVWVAGGDGGGRWSPAFIALDDAARGLVVANVNSAITQPASADGTAHPTAYVSARWGGPVRPPTGKKELEAAELQKKLTAATRELDECRSQQHDLFLKRAQLRSTGGMRRPQAPGRGAPEPEPEADGPDEREACETRIKQLSEELVSLRADATRLGVELSGSRTSAPARAAELVAAAIPEPGGASAAEDGWQDGAAVADFTGTAASPAHGLAAAAAESLRRLPVAALLASARPQLGRANVWLRRAGRDLNVWMPLAPDAARPRVVLRYCYGSDEKLLDEKPLLYQLSPSETPFGLTVSSSLPTPRDAPPGPRTYLCQLACEDVISGVKLLSGIGRLTIRSDGPPVDWAWESGDDMVFEAVRQERSNAAQPEPPLPEASVTLRLDGDLRELLPAAGGRYAVVRQKAAPALKLADVVAGKWLDFSPDPEPGPEAVIAAGWDRLFVADPARNKLWSISLATGRTLAETELAWGKPAALAVGHAAAGGPLLLSAADGLLLLDPETLRPLPDTLAGQPHLTRQAAAGAPLPWPKDHPDDSLRLQATANGETFIIHQMRDGRSGIAWGLTRQKAGWEIDRSQHGGWPGWRGTVHTYTAVSKPDGQDRREVFRNDGIRLGGCAPVMGEGHLAYHRTTEAIIPAPPNHFVYAPGKVNGQPFEFLAAAGMELPSYQSANDGEAPAMWLLPDFHKLVSAGWRDLRIDTLALPADTDFHRLAPPTAWRGRRWAWPAPPEGRWVLREGPPGMAVDETGGLAWQVPVNLPEGPQVIRASVGDAAETAEFPLETAGATPAMLTRPDQEPLPVAATDLPMGERIDRIFPVAGGSLLAVLSDASRVLDLIDLETLASRRLRSPGGPMFAAPGAGDLFIFYPLLGVVERRATADLAVKQTGVLPDLGPAVAMAGGWAAEAPGPVLVYYRFAGGPPAVVALDPELARPAIHADGWKLARSGAGLVKTPGALACGSSRDGGLVAFGFDAMRVLPDGALAPIARDRLMTYQYPLRVAADGGSLLDNNGIYYPAEQRYERFQNPPSNANLLPDAAGRYRLAVGTSNSREKPEVTFMESASGRTVATLTNLEPLAGTRPPSTDATSWDPGAVVYFDSERGILAAVSDAGISVRCWRFRIASE